MIIIVSESCVGKGDVVRAHKMLELGTCDRCLPVEVLCYCENAASCPVFLQNSS